MHAATSANCQIARERWRQLIMVLSRPQGGARLLLYGDFDRDAPNFGAVHRPPIGTREAASQRAFSSVHDKGRVNLRLRFYGPGFCFRRSQGEASDDLVRSIVGTQTNMLDAHRSGKLSACRGWGQLGTQLPFRQITRYPAYRQRLSGRRSAGEQQRGREQRIEKSHIDLPAASQTFRQSNSGRAVKHNPPRVRSMILSRSFLRKSAVNICSMLLFAAGRSAPGYIRFKYEGL